MLVEAGHVGTSVNHRHDQHPKFSSESTIISPFIHFQMPSTFSCGPNNTVQENLQLFDLCVPECVAVLGLITFPAVSMQKQSQGLCRTLYFKLKEKYAYLFKCFNK